MNEQVNHIQVPMERVPKSARIVSAFVDYMPMLLLSIIVNAISMKLFQNAFDINALAEQSNNNMSPEEAFQQIKELFGAVSVIILPSTIAAGIGYTYFFSKDFFGGRSIGKRMQKFQLVRLDGQPVSFTRMFVRNLFLVLWPIEVIMYLANSGQRLGDLLCKTTVVPATEENRQPVDTQKLVIAIALVAVFCALISYLYYQAMVLFFEWYLRFFEHLILNMK